MGIGIHSRPPLLGLLPPGRSLCVTDGVGIIGPRPSILLVFLLLRLLARGLSDGVVKVGGVVPAAAARAVGAQAGRGRVAILSVVALLVGVPELPTALTLLLQGQVDAGTALLAFFEGLVAKSGVGVALGVAARPLGLALLALDLRSINEAVLLDPFRRAGVRLVVTDVLESAESDAAMFFTYRCVYLDVEVMDVACVRASAR